MQALCRFCDIGQGTQQLEVNQPFLTNEGYSAIASIGALVEGWSLLLPKAHQVSMRECYRDPAFVEMANVVMARVSSRYGKLIAFEHGANKEGSQTSCGTDHAHLHFVPSGESLLPDMQASGLGWLRCRPNEVASIAEKDEYLFYVDLSGLAWEQPVGYLHVLQQPTSQFFRRLLAKRIGEIDTADYKQFPRLEVTMQTRKALAGSGV